jgi:hypothetical protein
MTEELDTLHAAIPAKHECHRHSKGNGDSQEEVLKQLEKLRMESCILQTIRIAEFEQKIP